MTTITRQEIRHRRRINMLTGFVLSAIAGGLFLAFRLTSNGGFGRHPGLF